MDWPGTLLAVLAAGGVTVVLLEGSAWGWTSARTLGGVAVGLAAMGFVHGRRAALGLTYGSGTPAD